MQGSRLPREVSRGDKLSLPGFENLTVGYNKFLRPNFGGKPSFLSRTSIHRTGAEEVWEGWLTLFANLQPAEGWQ